MFDPGLWRDVRRRRALVRRAQKLRRFFAPRIAAGWHWLWTSNELYNQTYDLAPRNRVHLAHAAGIAAGRSGAEMLRYMDELIADEPLWAHVRERVKASPEGVWANARMPPGRREIWYALARALKPKVIVETGVEKGLGSVILCAALIRNAAEGSPGRFYGTDIDPNAGWLLTAPYDSVGRILYGDSIESLQAFEGAIDLFVNDSDHSAEYEGREYRTIADKLAHDAVLVGDNAHLTDELLRFAEATGRRFLYAQERPVGDLMWLVGAGAGLAFR